MGSEIDTGSSFWKRYFDSEEDARKIDIFDLINASITVASFKKPDEFRSRRFQIMKSLFTIDSSRPIVKNPSKTNQQDPIIIHGCEDQACKDEIVPEESHKKRKVKGTNGQEDMDFKFDGENQQIEKAKRRVKILDAKKEIAPSPRLSCDSKAKMGSSLIVKNPSKITQEPITIQGCKDQACKDEIFSRHQKFDDLERELNEYAQPIELKKVNVHADKKRKAEVSKICRSGTKFEADMKRSVEEKNRKVGMDPYEYKFEVSTRRFEERNQQIEKAKRRVQILDTKEIARRSSLGRRDGKPKGGFGSRMKKMQQARF